MQKRKLRWILIIIIVAISLYQYANQDESFETVSPELPATLEAPEEESVVVTETETVEMATKTPLLEAESVEPTLIPTENPDQFANLEEVDGDFDFFVMALSWSPDYCASNDYQDAQQCSIGKQLDFVLHGLWPQYEQGWPDYCSTEELPYDLKDEYTGLYPSDKLFDHEWEKHGTCSGLSPEGYLAWSEALKEGLVIPLSYDSPLEPFRADADSLRAAFVAENPSFSENSFAIYCSGSGRFLKEIFVCYEKDGTPRECSDEILKKAAKSCGQEDFLVRNTR
jgi:ribonuclease T2